MDPKLAQQFANLLTAIDEAVISHEAGNVAPYSVAFLRQVRTELIGMRDGWPLFPFRFGRMIVDWPATDLGNRLLAFG